MSSTEAMDRLNRVRLELEAMRRELEGLRVQNAGLEHLLGEMLSTAAKTRVTVREAMDALAHDAAERMVSKG